jgi:SAM-dependent methyltransferase
MMKTVAAGKHIYWQFVRWLRIAEQRVALWREPVGRIDFGGLRRLRPISTNWGYERGLPIDRAYIEAFLHRHAVDIKGRVLEAGDDSYTRRFGGDRVTHADILHVEPGHPSATIVADLTDAPHIRDDSFDCIVLTQTLQFIYDVPAVIRTLHRIIAPGGAALITVPGVTQIGDPHWQDSWYWSFTEHSLRHLLASSFPDDCVHTEVQGNVLAATSFLHGIAAGELSADELAYRDPHYPVVVCARVLKPAS